jgi:hypothetical protein
MSTAMQPDQHAEDRIRWWREARFGLFIHWGPVSLVGTEIGWSRAGERRGFRNSLWPGTVPQVERLREIGAWLQHPIQQTITGNRILSGGQAVVNQSEQGIEIAIPEAARTPINTVVRLEVNT